MNATEIRSQNDLTLYESLLKQSEVLAAKEALEALKEKGYTGVRRRLLATSVRLSRRMAKTVYAAADTCVDRLEIELPLELYVYSSPQFNAACFNPEEGRLIVMFSSSLLESFHGPELCFVMGHELGHHVYRHHEIPIGYILNGGNRASPRLALDLFAWSRYAEISADRAGAHCAQNLNATALALFRLASGLSTNVIDFSLAEFLAQIDEMQEFDAEPRSGANREDWFSTHPFSPLRVKALQLFYKSELAVEGGTPAAQLEIAVQSTMSLMEPSYLEGRTDTAETMRRLLFAGAIAVAHANGEISDAEIEVFEKFFGEGSFRSDLDIEKIVDELPGRIEQAKLKTSVSHRIQVVRDLCLIARSDSEPTNKGRTILYSIARDLGVEESFVEHTLCGALDPD